VGTLSYAWTSASVEVDMARGLGVAFNANGDDVLGVDEFSGLANVIGGGGSDLIEGDEFHNRLGGAAGRDSLVGGFGNDTLDGGEGGDVFRGGSGNDVLVFDANDSLIDGGFGLDTLRVADAMVDFTQGGIPKIQGVEQLDLRNTSTGAGANTTVTLDLSSVRAMSGESNQFMVLGDSGDKVMLKDFAHWTTSTLGSDTVYAQGGVLLRVASGVAVEAVPIPGAGQTLIGTNANNTLAGGNSNDTLQPLAGSDSLNGGTGTDTAIFTPQFRVDTISLTSGSFGAQNNSHLVAVGDVNNDGLMDFAMRSVNTVATTAAYVYREDHYAWNGSQHVWNGSSATLLTQTFHSGHVYLVYGAANGVGALNLSITNSESGNHNGYVALTSTASAGEGFGNGLGA
jgi:hypothetical protein